jgi:septation ring formation regulator EzrA
MEQEHQDIERLEEELTEARAQLESFQATVADREARALTLEAELAEAREALETARTEIEARDGELAMLREQTGSLEAVVRASAERYRTLVLEQAPELPDDLITGTTIDEVDQSIERARETVSKVRGHLEAQMQSSRVPVGAPVRSERDTSGLSAQQKIAPGIEQRRTG